MSTPSTPSTEPAPSLAAEALRDRGQAVLKKKFRGEQLSNAEISALAKYEKLADRERRADAYARCTGEDLRATLFHGAAWTVIGRWLAETPNPLPRNPDRTFNLPSVAEWWHPEHTPCHHCPHRKKARGLPEPDTHEQIQRAKARGLELALALKLDQVRPVEPMKQWIWDYFHGLAARLQAWPRAVARSREEELRLAAEMTKLLAGFEAELAGATGGHRRPRKAAGA